MKVSLMLFINAGDGIIMVFQKLNFLKKIGMDLPEVIDVVENYQ